LLVLLPFQVLLAQTKYEKGYMVTDSGDSISCYIKNYKWLNSPSNIVFKKTLSASEQIMNASEIKLFQIEGYSKYLKINDSLPITDRFTSDKGLNSTPKRFFAEVFVKQLISGKASLYEYRGANGSVFLLQMEDSKPIPLDYKEYLDTNSNQILKNNIFRRQVLKMLGPDTDNVIQTLEYREKDLVNYLRKYNYRNGDYLTAQGEVVKDRKATFLLHAVGGVMQYQLTTTLSGREATLEDKLAPRFGLELESILPINNNEFAVFISGQYSSYSSEVLVDFNGAVINAAEVEFSQLTAGFGLRYYLFLSQKHSIMLNGGGNLDFNFNGTYTGRNEFRTTLNTIEDSGFSTFFGIGYSLKQKVRLSANYFLPTEFDSGQGSELKRLSVELAIRIF
ncbi:MAG: hypothetical protein AAFU57_01125, partial [Bacteroidota bacterium]